MDSEMKDDLKIYTRDVLNWVCLFLLASLNGLWLGDKSGLQCRKISVSVG